MDLKVIGVNATTRIDSAQDRNYWRALLGVALNLRVSWALNTLVFLVLFIPRARTIQVPNFVLFIRVNNYTNPSAPCYSLSSILQSHLNSSQDLPYSHSYVLFILFKHALSFRCLQHYRSAYLSVFVVTIGLQFFGLHEWKECLIALVYEVIPSSAFKEDQ